MSKKLLELKEAKYCDDQTAEALSINDNFIDEFVSDIYNEFKRTQKYKKNWDPEIINRGIQEVGEKLLFLEELVQEPIETQEKVKTWLSDDKRKTLFLESPQGITYGESLIANANNSLDEFREDYNKGLSLQEPWTYQSTLEKITKKEHNTKGLLDIKSEEVFKKTLEEILNNKLNHIDEYTKFITSQANYTKNTETKCYSFSDEPYKMLIELGSPNELFTEPEIENNIKNFFEVLRTDLWIYQTREDFGSAMDKFREKSNNYKVKIKNDIGKKFKELHEFLLESEDHDRAPNEWEGSQSMVEYFSEISALRDQYSNTHRKTSDKIKPGNRLIYSIKLSEKDPLDVTFGNDSGCCIGIYPNSDELGNAYGLPHTILDNATYIFNINQKINNRKTKRVGIVLAFDSETPEGSKILSCNSLELSGNMNPTDVLEDLVDFVEDGLIDFAKERGYKKVIMSSHEYNTSQNYSKRSENTKKSNFISKIKKDREPAFHSEILDDDKKITGKFYTLWE